MLTLLSAKLSEISALLVGISVALAAPAVYEITPQNADLSVSNEVVAVEGENPVSKELGGQKVPFNADPLPENPSQGQIRTHIVQSARYYGISEIMALELAKLESRFNQYAKNPNSSARGIYQFINSTFRDFCEGEVFNIENNVRCAHKMISGGNIGAWTVVTTTRQTFLDLKYITCSNFNKNICDTL